MMQPPTYLTDEQARALYAPLSAPDSTSKQASDSAHDFDHVARVMRLAVHIAEAECADVEVVRLAALLHDVPVAGTVVATTAATSAGASGATPDLVSTSTSHLASAGASAATPAGLAAGREHHHLAAAEYAGQLLAARGLAPARVANVVHCIAAHRFRDRSVTPATLEAKCLYDADKLDSIGAIGIARAFAYAGAHHSRLWHEPWPSVPPDDAKPQGPDYTPVHEFVYKLERIASTLHTDAARSIAAERHHFMCAFFDRLDAEMLGIA